MTLWLQIERLDPVAVYFLQSPCFWATNSTDSTRQFVDSELGSQTKPLLSPDIVQLSHNTTSHTNMVWALKHFVVIFLVNMIFMQSLQIFYRHYMTALQLMPILLMIVIKLPKWLTDGAYSFYSRQPSTSLHSETTASHRVPVYSKSVIRSHRVRCLHTEEWPYWVDLKIIAVDVN